MTSEIKQNQGVTSRVAAAHVLAEVFDRHHTLDEAMERVFRKYPLSDADKRLVHAISGFVFRRLAVIDTTLNRIMNRAKPPSPMLLQQLLRVGVAQVLYMDVAAHAAVHATVEAAGSLHLSRQKSLVNAVLRSVQRERDAILAEPVSQLAQLPQWLRSRWVGHYGQSAAEAYAGAMAAEAPIDVSLKQPHLSHEWGQKLGAEVVYEGLLRVHQPQGQLVSWPGFEGGEWWVQDLSASLPINMLGDIAGKSVLDVCAAPGGKTMQLASRGARVTALDVSATRMRRITENLGRVKLQDEVTTVVNDALHWRTDALFDIIVCDAPCTSTGTLRRHPELPWIHEEKQLQKTTASQHDLLRRAAVLLRERGIILYCTCSMEPEEGEFQVESFLNQNSNFKELQGIPAVVQPFLMRGLNNIGWRAYPTTMQDKGGMDGFYMVLLQKQ